MSSILVNEAGVMLGFITILAFGVLRIFEIHRGKQIFKFSLLYLKAFLYAMLAIWIGIYFVITGLDRIDVVSAFTFLFCCMETVSNLTDALEISK